MGKFDKEPRRVVHNTRTPIVLVPGSLYHYAWGQGYVFRYKGYHNEEKNFWSDGHLNLGNDYYNSKKCGWEFTLDDVTDADRSQTEAYLRAEGTAEGTEVSLSIDSHEIF
jgi:hypothetical protein